MASGHGVVSDIKVLGYACVGKGGCRHSPWRPNANWARRVLHAANLQTEWSEHPDQPIRGTAGRMAFVARMPFCAPGVTAAYNALPNLWQVWRATPVARKVTVGLRDIMFV